MGSTSTNNGVIGTVYALAMNGTNNLFVGGQFSSVDGSLLSASNIASWNGNSWNILGSNSANNGVNSIVYALAMNGTNNLFVAGQFSHVDGLSISANQIASWNGNSWNILGKDSINQGVAGGGALALAMNGTNNLLVAGYFSSIAGNSISASNIASWDGTWHSFGTEMDPQAQAVTLFQSNLFLGGQFSRSPDGFYCESNLIQSKQSYLPHHWIFYYISSKKY